MPCLATVDISCHGQQRAGEADSGTHSFASSHITELLHFHNRMSELPHATTCQHG